MDDLTSTSEAGLLHGPLLPRDSPGEVVVEPVPVVEVSQEKAGGPADSGSEASFHQPPPRWAGGAASLTSRSPLVEVFGQDKEWSQDIDSGSDIVVNRNYPRGPRGNTDSQSVSRADVADVPGSDAGFTSPSFLTHRNSSEGPKCGHHFRFMVFTILHTADFVLRVWSLLLFVTHSSIQYVAFISFLQFMGIMWAAYITFHDADILLWLHKISGQHSTHDSVRSIVVYRTLWVLFISGACIVFSCLQLIQVKRAYRRQLHAAEVMTAMDASREDRTDTRAATPSSLRSFGGSDRMLPVALFTGVPYLITVSFAVQKEPWVWNDVKNQLVLVWSLVMASATVSLGIVEIDGAVSSYVLKRYHNNPALKGNSATCATSCQWLYALCHIVFRAAEVVMRVTVISSFFLISRYFVGVELSMLGFFIDYVGGVVLLHHYAPPAEQVLAHMLVGVLFVVADLAHFIDQPGFAEPASHISTRLSMWRMLCWTVLLIVTICVGSARSPATADGWGYRIMVLSCSSVVYLLLRYSPPIRIVGQDLHTTARSGNLERMQKLLQPNREGYVLDINALTKDRKGMSPAMLAAREGHVGILEKLFSVGANVNLKSGGSENVCLHYAARRLQVQTCMKLIEQGADVQIVNKIGLQPKDVVPQGCRARCSSVNLQALLDMLRTDADMRSDGHITSCTSTRSHRGGGRRVFYAVRAEPLSADSTVYELFPDVELRDDNAPPPSAVLSVSGLVACRAFGVLARRVLAPLQPSGALNLGAMIRREQLGFGGFGRVIKVEVPVLEVPVFGNKGPREFALKLQPKQQHIQAAASEVLALQRASHPFIVRLEHAFQTPKYFGLLLELCPTDLNRLLCEGNTEGTFSNFCSGLRPKQAARYMGQILLALVYLHDIESIVYRDVKPENILIKIVGNKDEGDAKLTDFGLAETAQIVEHLARVGTPGFLAPEVFGGSILPRTTSSSSFSHRSAARSRSDSAHSEFSVLRDTFKLDAYSFGVTLQLALLGQHGGRIKPLEKKGPVMLPWIEISEEENERKLWDLVKNGQLSEDGYNLLVEKLLPAEPSRRSCLSDQGVMQHPFFLKLLECKDLEKHLLPSPSPRSHSSVVRRVSSYRGSASPRP